MSGTLTVQAPEIQDREVVKPTLCGPGPCDVWPSVQEAYSNPVLSPLCDEYFNVSKYLVTLLPSHTLRV